MMSYSYTRRWYALFTLLWLAGNFGGQILNAQSVVTYAGGTGKEVFYDALRLTNGNYLVGGYADDLNWVASGVPRQVLNPQGIKNGTGTNKIGFILHLSSDLKTILQVVHFPKGAVEDVRFIKVSSTPGQPTGEVFISGNTSDTKANNGGYFIAKLNNNFVSGIPTDLAWAVPLWAVGYPKTYHPWDVGSDGKVVYMWGESHGYDWAEARRLDANGVAEVVPNWRYHKLKTGSEFAGLASAAPGGTSAISYSSIIFKRAGRCDLRSWTLDDYNLVQPDGNGGTRKGKWPLDAFFSGPGDPSTGGGAGGQGYTGYSPAATFVYGPSALVIDRRTNAFYIGMNIKSVLPDGNPDFEPAVLAYDNSGTLIWWSRLYHEIRPNGTLVNSSPDQYVDDLAIDYSKPVSSASLVVLARSHGNNSENLWEGNTVAANPGGTGFQNQFTGNNGNIHLSWLGKFKLGDGTLTNSTYLGEFNEGSNNYGAALTDPNLDGWPNPNGGWPNLNTTRCTDVKVTDDGAVCVVCAGRKTITTANAFQKNVKPGQGTSPWSQFVRIYKPDLSSVSYSSLITGQFNPATGAGGDNTELYNVLPVANGVLALGMHKENTSSPGTSLGNAVPTANAPSWGSTTPNGQSAILAYLQTSPLTVSVCESAQSGEWTSSTTWSCGRVPTSTDVTIINSSHIITISTNTAQTKQLIYKGGKVVFSAQNARLFVEK
ncbi:hypothetical protein ACFSUS_25660 [Spirosoma soli]|uniref:Uncharacterized protein n=1 Tax=Spirosoma soli TaxID=1770529 RepID=A0ABW5MCQ8_9BACT